MPPGLRFPIDRIFDRGFHAPLPDFTGAGPICSVRGGKQVYCAEEAKELSLQPRKSAP